MNKRELRSTPHTIQKRKQSQGVINDLDNVDFVSSDVHSSRQEASLYVFEENETVCLRVGFWCQCIWFGFWGPNWFDRITNQEQLCGFWTHVSLSGFFPLQSSWSLTQGNFTRDEWNHLLCVVLNICHFSSINSLKTMSKRTQENAGEERVKAKSKPMTNLVSRCRVRDPTVLASTASENPENTTSASQKVPLSSLNVQQTGAGKPVMLASPSNSSEWNNDDKWSSQVRKSGEMWRASTEKFGI